MRTTRQLAEYVCSTSIRDMAPIVVERTKDLALSSLGSAVLGAGMDVSRILATYAAHSPGPPEAGVIGMSFRTSAEWAAALNCTSSHCTELEDVAWPDATYTCYLFPTVFSLADKLKASGTQVIEALVLGYEVTSRPGMTLTDGGGMVRGWLTCAAMGTVGAAAAAAKLMGLDVEQTHNAIALAASFGAGLNRQTGSPAHVIEAGFAGRNGITAAMLASEGLSGNPTILEGKAGFWDAVAGQPNLEFDLGRGDDFRVLAVGMKKFPCCYLAQRIVDGVLDLVKTHRVTGSDIESVEVGVSSTFPQILKYPDPENAEQARFSLPHIVAAAMSGESMFVETFTAERVHDPKLVAERSKVKMVIHPEWGLAQLGEKNTIDMRLKDGRVLSRECRFAKGDPENPLTRDEVLSRFMTCTDGLMASARRDEAAAMIVNLEKLSNTSALLNLLTYPKLAAA